MQIYLTSDLKFDLKGPNGSWILPYIWVLYIRFLLYIVFNTNMF